MTVPMRDRLARALDPDAFDRAALDRMSDVTTKAGDFERGQQRAYERLDAVLAVLREPDEALAMIGHGQGLGNIREAFTATVDAVRHGAYDQFGKVWIDPARSEQ